MELPIALCKAVDNGPAQCDEPYNKCMQALSRHCISRVETLCKHTKAHWARSFIRKVRVPPFGHIAQPTENRKLGKTKSIRA